MDGSRRVLLRTDVILMPLLTIAFGLQYYDKAVLGSASIFGLREDLNLVGDRYSQSNAFFYYGYLTGAFPMAFLVQRWQRHLNVFLSLAIVLWGAILMLTPAVSDWRGLYAQRFFLGFVESSVSPGFVAVTRMWYTKREQPIRLGIWYSATGLFSIFSSLVNSRLGNAKTSLAPWKLIFLVPGSITVFFGFLVLLLLPPSPLDPPLLPIPYYNRLSPDDRRAIDAKVRGNQTGNPTSAAAMAWNWSQAKEAAFDPKIYIFFLMATAIYVTNGAVTVFGPILVKAIGFTSTRATLLLTPGGATTAVSIYIVTLLATSKRLGFAATVPFARTLLLIVSCLPPIVGALMCWKGDWSNKAVPLAGYYLIPIFGAPFVLLLGMCTANIAGSTKQAIASASIFVGYNCGNIASSYILLPSEAKDHYPTTFKTVVGVMCATIGLALMLAAVMAWENKRRGGGWFGETEHMEPSLSGDRAEEEAQEKSSGGRASQESAAASTLLDETDRENKKFLYIL